MSDPIQDFIDAQLRSVWHSSLESKHHSRSYPWWPYMHNKEARSMRTNSHEDHLIDALDWKYHRKITRQNQVADKAVQGYTQTEIGLLLGISQQAVGKHIRKMRRRLRLWEKPKKE